MAGDTSDTDRPLDGQVAVVAGATRGAGRGIARALGEAGATVYCTGRSTRGHPSPYQRPETIEETAELIEAAGGRAIALRVDHTVEAEVKQLFERVEREQDRLDVLVNSIAGEDPMMAGGTRFWDTDLTNAEVLFRQAVFSRLITAKHAARLMVSRRRGLIVEVTENDLLLSNGDVVTQLVRMSHKFLATVYAADLRRRGVSAIAITPGFLRSERMLEYFGVDEDNWREAGRSDRNFLESESPQFVGRAIAALAADPSLLERTGQLFSSWEVGRAYDLTDIDGRRPDWGKLDIDYSDVSRPVIDAMLDGLQVQAAWLELLSRRTRGFESAFLQRTAALSDAMTDESGPGSAP